MEIHRNCVCELAIVTLALISLDAGHLSAQIVPDATLPNNSSVRSQDNIQIIEGGTQAGSNLFHSFEQFSIPANITAYFNNSVNIQNLITRITGKSISNINGTLRANGTANLFLINPHGIIFGENASLDIGGSFLASTASSINFTDGTKFSATSPETKPLLTINLPMGLQFGATAAPIRNQSQASSNVANSSRPVGLSVLAGKTLALIGGDVTLEGGNVTADSGQIELASVAGNSLVNLHSNDKGWVLGYEGVENFQNIQLITRNIDDSTIGTVVDVSGKNGDGSIRVRGNSVELIGFPVRLSTITTNDKNAGDININARKLIVGDGAQMLSVTVGKGGGGDIKINTSESVEVMGGYILPSGINSPSGLFSAATAAGKSGNITINTSNLLVKDGAGISAESSGLNPDSQFLPATGAGGNLTINASDSVEIIGSSTSFPSSLRANTQGSANAGNLTISTQQLILRDGAEINVSSIFPQITSNVTIIGDITDFGDAGELNITAASVFLDNQSKIISETVSAKGGNINFQLQDFLLMRRNSIISTNAGTAELEGDGGNITVNTPNGFIVAVPDENSDITANAFTGSGGKIEINATGIIGIQPRSRDELAEILATNEHSELNPQNSPTSEITAISQQSPDLDGELNINAQDVERTKETVELPNIQLNPKISQACQSRGDNQSQFIFTRRGGLPPLPSEILSSDSVLDIDWVYGESLRARSRRSEGKRERRERRGRALNKKQIIEATGWVFGEHGDIYFIAGIPAGRGNDSKIVSCYNFPLSK